MRLALPTCEVVLARRIPAPREAVFRAWTEAEALRRWWGPAGFETALCRIDPRPGGRLRIVMRAPGGTEHPLRGAFREVAAPERITLTLLAEDCRGDPLLECVARAWFDPDGSGTRLTVQASAAGLSPAAPPMLQGLEDGWAQSLERLAAFIGEHR